MTNQEIKEKPFNAFLIIDGEETATIYKEEYSAQYFGKTVVVEIQIDKDNTAELIMTKKAWKALKKEYKSFIEQECGCENENL